MSDWKQGAAKRRDARNAKAPETDRISNPKISRKKKDTKKWCRGKEGTEHNLKCVDYRDTKLAARDINGTNMTNLYAGWKLLVCTECGKEVDHYYPMRFRTVDNNGVVVPYPESSRNKKPDWVT